VAAGRLQRLLRHGWHALAIADGGADRKETDVVPILLWFLGVPGLIIIVLLLLGVIRF
jgi:hypothetical protein